MRSVDPDLAKVFVGSYEWEAFADVWYAGDLVYAGLPVVGGSVDWDGDADIACEARIQVADPDGRLVPRAAGDPLACFGQEIQLAFSAVGRGGAQSQPLTVARLRVQGSKSKEWWRRTPAGGWRHGGASIEVRCLDRMSLLADNPFLAPSQPPPGATVLTEITRLVEDLVPLGLVDPTLVDQPVPATTAYQDDRVAALQALAGSIGAVLSADSFGALQLRQPTQYGAPPVWTFKVGQGGDTVDVDTEQTRDGVINAVVVRGETADTHDPVQGIAYDRDPASPTRWDGPFGRVPRIVTNPLMTTPGQAGAAAKTYLNNARRGREREYTLTVTPNYLLEPDDPVQVDLPDRSLLGRIVKLSLPLTPGGMRVTVRALDTSITEIVV